MLLHYTGQAVAQLSARLGPLFGLVGATQGRLLLCCTYVHHTCSCCSKWGSEVSCCLYWLTLLLCCFPCCHVAIKSQVLPCVQMMALAAGPLTPLKERGEGPDGEGGSGDDQQDRGEAWEGTEPLGGTAAGKHVYCLCPLLP